MSINSKIAYVQIRTANRLLLRFKVEDGLTNPSFKVCAAHYKPEEDLSLSTDASPEQLEAARLRFAACCRSMIKNGDPIQDCEYPYDEQM